jgi:TolB-like protein/Tfp pilus assembly protein PilF
MSLVAELKRRSVFKVAAAYLVVAWLVIQVAATVAPQMGLPDWTPRFVTLIVMLGFPVALVLAWVFDVTPEGLKVETAPVGNKRMFTIAAVLAALAIGWYWRGAVGVGPGDADGPRSLAVIPFSALGADAETSGLAGGLHDTLITQLSKIKGLEVRSRTSVMKYKDWDGGLKQIADELGVSVVLEGSVQRVGNRTVVNAQLIDARTDAHLWAETIDRTGDDLFALQSEIAQRVTKALAVALSPAEQQALTVAPTQDTAAYALYVDAVRITQEAGAEQGAVREAGMLKAVAMFEAAVAKDPQFALAWAMLARTYANITWNTTELPYEEYAAKTRAVAQRAIELGPDLPEARFAAGVVALQLDFDFPRAVRELTAATQGMPSNPIAFSRLAQAQDYTGDADGALVSYAKAFELEPSVYTFARDYIVALVASRRFDEARVLAQRIAKQHPGNYRAARQPAQIEVSANGDLSPMAAFVRSTGDGFRAIPEATSDRWWVATAAGDHGAALAVLDSAIDAAGPDFLQWMRAESLRALGRNAEATREYQAMRDRLLKQLSTPRDPFIEALAHTDLAFALARLGDAKGAREHATRADQLWGVARDPADGAWVWYGMAIALHAAGDVDAALEKLTWLADNRSIYTAGELWTNTRLAPLHSNPKFRALMQKHGVDVTREPFAVNRAAAKAEGAK